MSTHVPRRLVRLALCSTLVVGGAAAGLVGASGLGAGAAAAPIVGSELSPEEAALVALLDPDDRARFLLQKRIQQKSEMASLVAQLQQLRDETAMSVINNIR